MSCQTTSRKRRLIETIDFGEPRRVPVVVDYRALKPMANSCLTCFWLLRILVRSKGREKRQKKFTGLSFLHGDGFGVFTVRLFHVFNITGAMEGKGFRDEEQALGN